MGIVYKITCDQCAEKYPADIDSEMHHGSFFGTHPDDAVLEIKNNLWTVTMENDVLCPVCSSNIDLDPYNDDGSQQDPLKSAAFKLPNGDIITGKTHVEAWFKGPGQAGKLPLKRKSEKEAVKDLMQDCEVHFHIDSDMLTSAARFYEFMYTEIMFHADCWRLDFEKAQKAYLFWAKKYHSIEYR